MSNQIDSLLKKRVDIVWIGAILGLVYWIWQSFRDAVIFQKSTFLHSLISPDFMSFATRLLVICVFLLICIHAKYIQEKILEDKNARSRSTGYWAFIIAAVGFIMLYWIIDSFQDIIGQARGAIVERVLTPEISILVTRFLSVLFLAILVFLVQYLFTTRKKAEKVLKEAHEQLARSRENLNKIVMNDIDAIFVLNVDFHIVFVNPAAEKMLHKTSDQLVGQPFNYPVSPHQMREIEIINDLGETVIVESNAVDIEWAEEKAMMVQLRDITERRHIERIRQHFLALISHRLKSPIVGIKGAIENMLNGLAGELSEQQREYLLLMKESVTTKFHLLEDLLTVLRLEAGGEEVSIEPVVLKDMVGRALQAQQFLITKKGLTVKQGDISIKLLVDADTKKLEKVIHNVIHNAVKFTSEGSIALEVRSDDRNAILTIEDTGCGMSDTTLKTIFHIEKKAQSLADANIGMGFGLYIAKKFMSLQNGDLSVESVLGRGSVFSIIIPLHI